MSLRCKLAALCLYEHLKSKAYPEFYTMATSFGALSPKLKAEVDWQPTMLQLDEQSGQIIASKRPTERAISSKKRMRLEPNTDLSGVLHIFEIPLEVWRSVWSFLSGSTLASLYDCTTGWTTSSAATWASSARPPTFALKVDYGGLLEWEARLCAIRRRIDALIQDLFALLQTAYMQLAERQQRLDLRMEAYSDTRLVYEPARDGSEEFLRLQNKDAFGTLILSADRRWCFERSEYVFTLEDFVQDGKPGEWRARIRRVRQSCVDMSWMSFHGANPVKGTECPRASDTQSRYKPTLHHGPVTLHGLVASLRTRTKVAWLEDFFTRISSLALTRFTLAPFSAQGEVAQRREVSSGDAEDSLSFKGAAEQLDCGHSVYFRMVAGTAPLAAASKCHQTLTS